jgi:hypothetical protein
MAGKSKSKSKKENVKAKKPVFPKAAKPLSKEEIYKNIEALPPALREEAKKLYESKMPKRHGSRYFARLAEKKQTKALGLTADDRKLMAKMYANKASYRALEGIWHLHPASGNDVYRQVQSICEEDRKLALEVKGICRKTGQTVPKAARNARPKPKAVIKTKPKAVKASKPKTPKVVAPKAVKPKVEAVEVQAEVQQEAVPV